MMLWRAKHMAAMPNGLFERLIEDRGKDAKRDPRLATAHRHRAFNGEIEPHEDLCCPHCGHLVVRRSLVKQKDIDIIWAWRRDQRDQVPKDEVAE